MLEAGISSKVWASALDWASLPEARNAVEVTCRAPNLAVAWAVAYDPSRS
jgi:hypothetical protein